MRELLFFAIGATVAGTAFVVSLLELLLTVRRRKAEEAVREQVANLKTSYNEAIQRVTQDDLQKLQEVKGEVDGIKAKSQEDKGKLEEEYQQKLNEALSASQKELEAAKARAKKLESEAKLKAEEYLAQRQHEVEEDLMNLVVDVTKRVLPKGLSYDIQKELVLEALREIKAHHE